MTGAVLLGLGLVALIAAAGGGRRRTGGGVTSQTRARVAETLATPDSQTGTIPVETPPRAVDPDRATPAASSGATTSTTTSTPSADMTFTPDAAGRYPGEPGYVDPGEPAPRTTAASSPTGGSFMTTTPPEGGGSGGDYTTDSGMGPRDPAAARAMASDVARAIRNRSSGWRDRVREFQRAAGITADGYYGGLTYNALRYFGINSPPATSSAPRPSAPEANYVDRVIAPARA